MATVAFDAMGVLYSSGDDVAEILIPCLRELSCPADSQTIADLYRRASLGQLTSAELWTTLGVRADDDAYCARHALTPGISDLLVELAEAGTPMACLSNDVREWSVALRRRFGLDRWIGAWVVSGATGVRKPDPAAFAALVEATGVPAERLVFFDDRPVNVNAARAAGIDAIRFTGVAAAREQLRARGVI
ncbi:MAG: HAD-IA family hydrolase [Actinomycetia bacterium]|nr:HAD-IA family hydrolase [Actinomycetes bacterium]